MGIFSTMSLKSKSLHSPYVPTYSHILTVDGSMVAVKYIIDMYSDGELCFLL